MEPLTFANTVRGEEMAAELVMLRRRTAELEQRTNDIETQCREEIHTLAQAIITGSQAWIKLASLLSAATANVLAPLHGRC